MSTAWLVSPYCEADDDDDGAGDVDDDDYDGAAADDVDDDDDDDDGAQHQQFAQCNYLSIVLQLLLVLNSFRQWVNITTATISPLLRTMTSESGKLRLCGGMQTDLM